VLIHAIDGIFMDFNIMKIKVRPLILVIVKLSDLELFVSTAHSLFEALKNILPEIAGNALRTEYIRRIPEENMQLIKRIGLHRAFQPKKFGGAEMSLFQFTECIVLLAGACASTAWVVSLLCSHSHLLALFSARTQHDVWGSDPDAVACSSIAPHGLVEEVDGGILFTGEKGWSSGCDHAQWSIIGFHRMTTDGSPQFSLAVLPRSDYGIRDEWFAAGMKGSGTKTLLIDRVFIPEYRIQRVELLMQGQSDGFGIYPDSEIFYSPFRPYFASGFSCVSLGIAQRALVLFQDSTAQRIKTNDSSANGLTPRLMRLAESNQQVASAEALLKKIWRETTQYSAQHRYPSRMTLALWRTGQAYAIKMCIEAVDRLFTASGGQVWLECSEMQRLFRDSHMTGAHIYGNYDSCMQILGRELAGLDPDPNIF